MIARMVNQYLIIKKKICRPALVFRKGHIQFKHIQLQATRKSILKSTFQIATPRYFGFNLQKGQR